MNTLDTVEDTLHSTICIPTYCNRLGAAVVGAVKGSSINKTNSSTDKHTTLIIVVVPL